MRWINRVDGYLNERGMNHAGIGMHWVSFVKGFPIYEKRAKRKQGLTTGVDLHVTVFGDHLFWDWWFSNGLINPKTC